MSELRDSIERWCREESMTLTVGRDEQDLGNVSCGDPLLNVSIRRKAEAPGAVALSHTFNFSIADAPPEDSARLAALCENVALARSSLVECVGSQEQGSASVDVAVTLFEEGLSKLQFIVGLDEVRKVGAVVQRELEAASIASGVLADVQRIIAQSAAFVSTGMEAEVPVAEIAEQATKEEVVEEVAVATPEPPSEAEVPAEPVVSAPAESQIYCVNCGFAVASDAKFCRSCGAKLEVDQA